MRGGLHFLPNESTFRSDLSEGDAWANDKLHVIYAVMWAWLLHNNIPSGKHCTSIQEIGFICSFSFRMMPPYCMVHQEPWISLNVHNRDERKRRFLRPAYKGTINSPGLHGCYAMPWGNLWFSSASKPQITNMALSQMFGSYFQGQIAAPRISFSSR